MTVLATGGTRFVGKALIDQFRLPGYCTLHRFTESLRRYF